MVNNILKYTLFILAFILIISLYSLLISIFPRKHITPIQPSDLNLKYKNITLTTSDNIKLDAWFIPNNKTKNAIIVGHGYPFDKGNILPIAEFLHRNYSLLLFDFRAMGRSEGRYTTVGYKEVEDVKAAIKYLKEKNLNIGAMGFSLSAATIIMAKSPEIKAIVADSSYANLNLMIDSLYRQFLFLRYPFTLTTKLLARIILKIDTKKISPQTSIAQLKTPILLIHGEKDSQIHVENSYLLKKANHNAELWIVKGADHGQAYSIKKQEYEKKVMDFFNKHLQ